jgi:tetratricopeptide (TPR) repeat protein
MGSVFRAEDLELGRAVALKRLHAEGERARAHLLREARAAAQLQHPNVVAIYEVGDHGGAPFIAMELVDGDTLTAWLRAAPRTSREIVAVLAQAARGLAAAHARGLVHRDFKPDNVLVDASNRARVVDFGLARATSDLGSAAAPTPGDSLSTTTGAAAGSPAYLAPELVRGEAPGARSDQYAFGVTAFQALRGKYPFAGDTAAEVWNEMAEGRIRDVGRNLPPWLDRSVRRSLSVDATARWPDMAAFAAALERRPRRGWLAAIAVLILVAVGYLVLRQPSEVCTGGDTKVAGVWNALTKARTRAAFSTTHLPSADYVWQLIDHQLDRYSDDWSLMHREACEATRRRGEQSEQVMDLRMGCLTQRLQELRTVTDVFAGADPHVVSKAVDIASALSPITGCADVDALRASMPAQDPVQMVQVSVLRDQLARARVLYHSMNYQDGMRAAEDVVTRARATRYQPVVAEALDLVGTFQVALADARAEDTLERAFMTAESCGHDTVAIEVAALLAIEVGANHSRGTDGSRWLGIARAILTRHPDERGAARVASASADLLDNAGRYDEALAEYRRELALRDQAAERDDLVVNAHVRISYVLSRQGRMEAALDEARSALAIAEKALGPDSPVAGHAHLNMGGVLERRGRYAEALVEFRSALASLGRVLGPTHPDVGVLHGNIGLVLMEQGNTDAAVTELRQALAIKEQALGRDHPLVAKARNRLGNALNKLGRYEEALVEFRRALAIQEGAGQKDHPDAAQTYVNIGVALTSLYKYDDAIAQFRRALDILTTASGPEPDIAVVHADLGATLIDQGKYEQGLVEERRALALQEKAFGPEHPEVLQTRQRIGLGLAEQGRFAEALAELTQVLALDVKVLGPEHPSTVHAMADTGRMELGVRRYGSAIEHLQRALAFLEATSSGPDYIPDVRFNLAKALWGANTRPDEAIALARQAREDCAKLPFREPEVAEIEAWLAEHGHRVK